MKIASALLSIALLFGTGAVTSEPADPAPQVAGVMGGCPPWLWWQCHKK
ncbi:hypothetical protein [Bifidobacterium leontopitheci]|uniref:Uncharacterized protein n=1 Tax=Bifidobacterium leontopitheci TaxID=2650774 RepID=A0A6I1GIH0_9BIFI|nr:hypothetical protein [Bifidobacterium leontopitheci]KAB7791480.1 hypothetical protein F7D09_0155 [Bifidobacterium leontopitheci]